MSRITASLDAGWAGLAKDVAAAGTATAAVTPGVEDGTPFWVATPDNVASLEEMFAIPVESAGLECGSKPEPADSNTPPLTPLDDDEEDAVDRIALRAAVRAIASIIQGS
jgi:hypothetical protein